MLDLLLTVEVEFERFDDGQIEARVNLPGLTVIVHSDEATSPRVWDLEEIELVHEPRDRIWFGAGRTMQRVEHFGMKKSVQIGAGDFDYFLNREFDRWIPHE